MYLCALVVAGIAISLEPFLPAFFRWIGILTILISVVAAGGSLLASWYIYDRSKLYDLRWLDGVANPERIVNIGAGFDETSPILRDRFPDAELRVWDFFDAAKHTEASIRRARQIYPPDAETVLVSSGSLPMEANRADLVCLFMSAHEIRLQNQRVEFFREVHRILRPGGKVFVTEHLRDAANAAAYTLGVLHFHSRETWLSTFEEAGLKVIAEHKTTRFVSTFVLEKS